MSLPSNLALRPLTCHRAHPLAFCLCIISPNSLINCSSHLAFSWPKSPTSLSRSLFAGAERALLQPGPEPLGVKTRRLADCLLEVADEVRLVVVAEIDGESRTVDLSPTLHSCQDFVQPAWLADTSLHHHDAFLQDNCGVQRLSSRSTANEEERRRDDTHRSSTEKCLLHQLTHGVPLQPVLGKQRPGLSRDSYSRGGRHHASHQWRFRSDDRASSRRRV